MTIALDRPVGTTDPVTLVGSEVMERLSARIVKDHAGIDRATARRIVAQTAAFLAASAQQPGAELSPSKLVDIGWHTWILHTVDYALFCEQVAGRFIHHVPTEDDEQVTGGPETALERTLGAITQAGFTIDPDLWPAAAKMGECSQCHAGCSDSPNGGKKSK
ncbi:glycine-rich domain-containing protein [Streptomyces sp. NPDC002889]|uniref:glycine-rich domain-containing protein n=1 Tax=Streptomyces sp. NPDC002889 TaxID=3364669 RepID=UPI0036CDE198